MDAEFTWWGKDIDLMTKEELIIALKWCGSEIHKIYNEVFNAEKFNTKLMSDMIHLHKNTLDV